MIKCKVCGQEFENVIGWKHLKKHDMTTKKYKEIHGEVASTEYRAAISKRMTGTNNPSFGQHRHWTTEQKENIKGRIPHNKGVQMSDSQKTKLRDEALSRNHHWRQTDTHPLKGHSVSDETKLKISQSISDYAAKNPEQMQSRTAKAIQTKIDRGYDFAPFKGHTHSQETKKKISKKSKQSNKLRAEDGDHITKEHTRVKVIKSQGYRPVRVMFYYPQREQAIRIQETLKTLYAGVDGEYYAGDAAWDYLKTKSGYDLRAILTEIANRIDDEANDEK
jgi:hypothetical protein